MKLLVMLACGRWDLIRPLKGQNMNDLRVIVKAGIFIQRP
jgi:hypothetical protein